MSFRFITKSIHAYVIDYPFAIVLLAAPFVLKLGQSEPVAMWLSVVVGVAAFNPLCACPIPNASRLASQAR